MLREEFPAAETKDDTNAVVRFDLRFPLTKPEDKPKELWFDHAIVQECAATYADDVIRFLEASTDHKPDESPAFIKMKKKKERHYSSLMMVATRLLAEHKLTFQPKFLFPVISALGFLNDDMRQLLKSVVNKFKDTQDGDPERRWTLARFAEGTI